MPSLPVLAFFGSLQEWIVILVLGLLLFGRRLPEVGRQVGRGLAELRRHVDQFKAEIERDDSLRSARDSLGEARRGLSDLKRTTDIRRQLPTPKGIVDDLTQSAREAGHDVPDDSASAAADERNGADPEAGASPPADSAGE
ncbi:MAG: twin-arginine translocase TatA/TatE family subunit [Planctomycetota bacterium]